MAEAIFNGQQTIDVRFSQTKTPPFGEVSVGDIVYIKPVGKDISGQAKVKKVAYFEGMEQQDRQLIEQFFLGQRSSFENQSFLKEYIDIYSNASYVTIIYLDNVEQFIVSPVMINKNNRRDWVVLG